MHVNINSAVIERCDAVHYNLCITITQFVILVNNELLVFFVFFFDELFSAEKIDQLVLFVGFFHDTFQFLVRQDSISINRNLIDFNLFLLVNDNIYVYLVFIPINHFLNDFDFCILEPFIVKMSLNQQFRTVDQVWCDLTTFGQSQLCFQIFAFTLFDTNVLDISDTRTLRQDDFQINLVAYNLFCFDSYIREQTMSPVTFNGSCNVITRNSDCLTDRKTGKTNEYIVLIVLDTFYLDSTDFIFFRCS